MNRKAPSVDKRTDALLNIGILAFVCLIFYRFGFFESIAAALSIGLLSLFLLLVAFVVLSALEKITA